MAAIGNYEVVEVGYEYARYPQDVVITADAPAGKKILSAGVKGSSPFKQSYPNADGSSWVFVPDPNDAYDRQGTIYLVVAEMGC